MWYSKHNLKTRRLMRAAPKQVIIYMHMNDKSICVCLYMFAFSEDVNIHSLHRQD